MGVAVTLGPDAIATFFDGAGLPLAGGFVYTYEAGTNIQQATYTDSTGTIPNPNPILLDSAGRAEIWFEAAAYKIIVQNSMGVQQYSVDNFAVGVFAAGNNTFTGTNDFNGIATNFNGEVNINAGGEFSGPIGGNPTFIGTPIFSNAITARQFISTVATGTPPIVAASTTVVPQLNVENVNGVAFPIGGSIGTVPQITAPNVVSYLAPPAYKVESVQVSSQTVAGTSTPTAMYTFTLPANEISSNQILRLLLQGFRTSLNADGSEAVYTILLDGVQILIAADGNAYDCTGVGWNFQVSMGFSSGNLYVTGGLYFVGPDGAAGTLIYGSRIQGGNSSGYVAFDPTITHTFTVQAHWSAGVTATESTTATLLLVERLG